MGQRFEFTCAGCGYSAVVSGGGDCGECIYTQTIACMDCRKLLDVVSAVIRGFEEPGMELTGEFEEPFLIVRMKCEHDPTHRWREWNAPDVCPRCESPMKKSGWLAMLWD